jgi:flagella basal body P-ring formation protein FlgA
MLRLAVLLTMIALPHVAVALSLPLNVELREEANVPGRVYRLADVATISGEDEAAVQLAGVELGRAPRPGYWADLTKQEIAARLERTLPGISRKVTWSGSEMVRVGAVGVAYPAARLSDFAGVALLEGLQQRFEQVKVELTGEPRDLIVPQGQVELSIRDLDEIVPTKRLAVWVDLDVDGEHYQSLPVWFRVSAWTNAVIAARDLDRSDVIASGDLSTASIDITTVRGRALVDPGDVVGSRVLRPLAAGGVFVDGIAERAPPIQQGQLIEVDASAGRILLRSKAIAMADGDLNERIAVQNPNSGEQYFATVVGPGQVRVK